MTTRIFLASGHVTFVDSLQALLDAHRDLKVIGKADNGREALKRIGRLRPDVAVLSIALPRLNGIEATSRIRKVSPSTSVIILSGALPPQLIQRALHAGALACLPGEASGEELIEAVRAASRGARYLSKRISSAIVQDYIGIDAPSNPLDILSAREREILQLVVEGESSVGAAAILSLSPKTVDTYRSRIRQKLGIQSLAGLVLFALQNGIISADAIAGLEIPTDRTRADP